MANLEHVDIPLGEIHIPHNWEYADAAARTAAVITDITLIKHLALQLDDGSGNATFWLLTGVSPATWLAVGGAGGGGVGPQGPQGIQGIQGVPGTNGVDGKTVLSGAGAPSAGLGVDGDFFIDTSAWNIYGPKTGGAWGTATTLVGPQGPQGIQGIQGIQGLQGAPGAGAALTVKDEGTTIDAGATQINFIGSKITATSAGAGSINVTVADTTKADVGLGNADNTSDANKPVSTAQAAAINAKEPAIAAGVAGQWIRYDKTAQNIPKADVGLSNVDNTSDVNKPVSTAQAAADTSTLNTAKAYADSLVVGLWDDRGNYNASVNTFPAAGGSGTAGAVLKGDIWTITVAGTLGGVAVSTGQTVRATVDTPGQTAGNWAISVAGLANIDDSITDGITGRAPSQNAVFDALALKENAIAAGSASQYLKGDKTLGTFLTDVMNSVLTGFSTATATAAVATDTLLAALGKFQGQINSIVASAVTLTGAQNLTNKTLTAPTVAGGSVSQLTTFGLKSVGGTGYDLVLAAPETLTAARSLSFILNDVNRTINLGGNVTTGGAFTMAGAFTSTFTLTANTAVTFPTAGTLATLAGAETLTNKTLTTPTLNNPTITGFTESGVNPAAGAAFTVDLSLGSDFEYTLNAAGTITLPAVVAGKSFTVGINFLGAYGVTWAGATIRWTNGNVAPTATSVNGKGDLYVFKANRAGTAWIGNDGGRNF